MYFYLEKSTINQIDRGFFYLGANVRTDTPASSGPLSGETSPPPRAPKEPPAATAGRRFEGVGELIAVQPRKSRLVVDHEEIKDFMAPMVMSYQVTSAKLLQDLKAGDKIRFTIDADKRAIVNIVPLTFRGEGTVILADTRRGQIVVDHKEIPGFIGAMTMRYPVRPARLLTGLAAGDRIRFTIDADERAIVDIKPYAE